MKNKIVSAKNKINTAVVHVHRNRGKYAAATTAAAFLVLMNRNAKVLNEFLEEHNLLDEYYAPEDEN